MATRSMIALDKGDGKYDAVYCHFDGYPEGVGKTLAEHYQSEDKVKTLIQGGGMSCLVSDPEGCEYYTRQGENLQIYSDVSLKDLTQKAKNLWCEHLYVYTPTAENTLPNKWSHKALYN